MYMAASSLFAKIFPPPRYMTLPSVGVDISESSLKYIQFAQRGARRSLARWGDIPIPEGVVSRGDVTNKAALVEVLRQVRAACSTPYVRLSLPEERAYLFETTIERGTSYNDIRGLLEFRMEENVPLSPRDAFFDYDIVEDDVDDKVLRVGVAVYGRETIVNYYDACIEAKLLPLSFEVEADAIVRAASPQDDDGTFMVIDFGKTRTGIGIVHKRALLYTSTIDIGGVHLSNALRQVYGDVAEDELTKLKNEKGLLHTGEENDVYEALLPTVAALKDEIDTRIVYWNTRTAEAGERAIEKVILCGGSANMAGLPEYFTEVLGIETERADIWKNVFVKDTEALPITRRYSYGYATAVGLALRDELS